MNSDNAGGRRRRASAEDRRVTIWYTTGVTFVSFHAIRPLAALLFVLAVAGCSSMRGTESASAMILDAESFGGARSSDAPAPSPSSRSAVLETMSEIVSEEESPMEPAPANRLRVFSADITVSVASVDDSREALLSVTDELGGYVESSQRDYVVIRVPAATFDRAITHIASLGIVIDRSIRAADVTEQYADISNRLRIAVAARERLEELLARSDDSEEQVKILREIRRLTEEIEQLRGEIGTLDQLIAFSRVAVTLVPRRQTDRIAREEIPFGWIRRLDPLAVSTSSSGALLRIEVETDFAQFSTGRFIRAESADGVRIRVGAVENSPRGSREFWQRALSFHLRLLYRSVAPTAAGEFSGVLLESKGGSPYYYLVVVRPAEDELIVGEAFFPSEETFGQRFDQIVLMFEGAYR